MRSERRGELHRHVALVATERDATPAVFSLTPAASGFSLLRLSVPARLLIVAIASALLWGAVLWALG
ncbi:MAG: hypothetical protein H7X74_00280 [Methyloceanibacter sp.]|nr:hypothetical protein [Methyloceanibacter sp.]